MNKKVSYVLVIVGLLILVIGIKPVNEQVVKSLPVLAQIDGNILLIVGLVVIIAGAVMLRNSSSRQSPEVPIYHGEEVVGFRRMGKKKRR